MYVFELRHPQLAQKPTCDGTTIVASRLWCRNGVASGPNQRLAAAATQFFEKKDKNNHYIVKIELRLPQLKFLKKKR